MFKRVIVLAVAAALAGMALSGCSSSDSTPPPSATAKFRVVHASPDAGPMDIYIGTSVTPWLEDVDYGMATVYLSRGTGTVVLTIRQADADPSTDPGIQSDPIDLAAGASLTILMTGQITSGAVEDEFRMIIYSDNFQNSPTARARVVHAGSDAPNVTVSVGKTGQVLADDLARWEESGRGGNEYEAREDQDIVVQAAGSQVTSFRAPELEAKKDYYFFLIGLISDPGTATTPFDLLIVGPGGVLPLDQTESRDFRLVHAVPDGGPVDPYLVYGFGDGQTRIRITQDLRYGGATPYSEAKVHQVYIELYDVGANPDQDQPVFTQSAYIHDEGNSTTVVAAGLSASPGADDKARLFSLSDNFDAHMAGTVFVQPVHACSNLDALTVEFDDDGSTEARMDRFSGNDEGWLTLAMETAFTMVVRDEATTTIVDEFTTPAMAELSDYYLILTGIKDGTPGFALLSVNEDGAQGFTAPN